MQKNSNQFYDSTRYHRGLKPQKRQWKLVSLKRPESGSEREREYNFS